MDLKDLHHGRPVQVDMRAGALAAVAALSKPKDNRLAEREVRLVDDSVSRSSRWCESVIVGKKECKCM